MAKTHGYDVTVTWTGNTGSGTSGYRQYARTHEVAGPGKPLIPGSSDPAFRGEPERWNPEELLVAALSQCHMLWYLNLCAAEGIVVTEYVDHAHGTMVESPDGGGHFVEVVLRPAIRITQADRIAAAERLHEQAHHKCFIANSVNFPVRHEPVISSEAAAGEAAGAGEAAAAGEVAGQVSARQGGGQFA
jgi:organic hydroperoxide reductase OsmC/OhrA